MPGADCHATMYTDRCTLWLVKRRDLEKRLTECGWRFLRSGGRHDVWTDGEREEAVRGTVRSTRGWRRRYFAVRAGSGHEIRGQTDSRGALVAGRDSSAGCD